MRLLSAIAALAFALWVTPASAQNTICPTAPIGTSNNQCASTAFVQNQIGVGITVGVTPIVGGTSGRIPYDNAGIFGELPVSGTGNVALVGSPAFTGSPTAPTQATNDNTTKIATDAFVQQQIAAGFSCANLPSGVDCNTLNAQTAAYPAATTDCGKTITLGGAAFYTLTVGAASGFPSTCSIIVVNIDSGRGKTISINGISFPNDGILWPLQTFTLKAGGGSWFLVNAPSRWKLLGNVQFEVNSAGSNSNDGLSTGSANAFQTINGAISVINNVVDTNLQQVKLHLNCSGGVTYTGSVRFFPLVGQPVGNNPPSNLNPILSGDTSTPTNCLLTSASGATIEAVGATYWNIEGLQLTNTDGSSPCVLIDQHSWIRAGVMNYGSCNGTSGNQIVVENLSGFEPTAAYTISASASSHVYTQNNATSVTGGAFAITLSGTPAFPGGFVSAARASTQIWNGVTFSGSATGVRCTASLNGVIDSVSGTPNSFFPGNSNCTTATGGQIN